MKFERKDYEKIIFLVPTPRVDLWEADERSSPGGTTCGYDGGVCWGVILGCGREEWGCFSCWRFRKVLHPWTT